MILLNYFKSDFNVLPLPSYDSFQFIDWTVVSLCVKYGLSLGLLYTIFRVQ
jgi:hypothetical protein